MHSTKETMKKTQEKHDLQQLYRDVTYAVEQVIEKNKTEGVEAEQLNSLRADMHDIIYALHEPPKAIPSALLPKALVPLICKLLTADNEAYFEQAKFTEQFANPAIELPKIKKLFQQSKSEPFRSIMQDLQRTFTDKYLKRFDLEAMRIYKEERAILAAFDNPKSSLEHKEKLKQELITLTKHALKVRDSFAVEKKFFDHYNLPNVGYTTAISFSFTSLQTVARTLSVESSIPKKIMNDPSKPSFK